MAPEGATAPTLEQIYPKLESGVPPPAYSEVESATPLPPERATPATLTSVSVQAPPTIPADNASTTTSSTVASGCCTITLHCCGSCRLSLTRCASVFSFVAGVIHSLVLFYFLQLSVRNDAFGEIYRGESPHYVEITSVNFVASWVLPALCVLSAVRIRCWKPKTSEKRTGSFVLRCLILSVHLYGIAQIAMFVSAYKDYVPYVSMKSDVYVCGLATMGISSFAALLQFFSLCCSYRVVTKAVEDRSVVSSVLWQVCATCHIVALVLWILARIDCDGSTFPYLFAVNAIVAGTMMLARCILCEAGRRFEKAESLAVVFVFTTTAFSSVTLLLQAPATCLGGFYAIKEVIFLCLAITNLWSLRQLWHVVRNVHIIHASFRCLRFIFKSEDDEWTMVTLDSAKLPIVDGCDTVETLENT
ncbi:hypothetical protein AAVH_21715 [Aphelenchoides avenae]|nr:hypothetical protein AAVH_21715 [Aphelenchus avenae]